MTDAKHYRARERLRNNLELCIRAARPDDEQRIVEAFAKLDPESIYLRFFGPKKELSKDELAAFRDIDFDLRVTLFGTVTEHGREIIVAGGTYVRIDDRAAEVAFLVEEDFHRLGISRRLLSHLGRIAVAAGLQRFVAEVLPQNAAMLGVFGRCGWAMTSHQEGGTVHVILDLTSSAPGHPS
ncbi:MAG: GNAT family N-acetyltransferase [Candidatus Accumulibacter sp.]|uniref:GNAT family N-acetyltransferase n=1 Tax=Accumulibacter sp. TaxID=2053492 RepID=UPI00287A5D68|nr:GNAT family N-acetyltransferase [Accumulibacter sp.]MDS4015672.1 GNAT family N-acetyltransferase [Accumulibacter sp.]